MKGETAPPETEAPAAPKCLSLEERRFAADEHQRRFERQQAFQQYAADEAHRLDERRREGLKLGRWRLFAASAAPLLGPSAAALIAFLASLHAERTNTATALQVESLRDQSQLILQTLNGRTQPQTIVALQFLARAGMIPDYQKAVLNLTTDKGGSAIPSSPFLPIKGQIPTERNEIGEVIILRNGKIMQLPADLHCGFDRRHMIEHTFIPKIGPELDCRTIFLDGIHPIPFDERTFEKFEPGSEAR